MKHTATTFEGNSKHPTRALQAYLALISCAANHQIITYGDLSKERMKFGKGGVIANVLGHIMHWCRDHNLPPLTVLVVNGGKGVPGSGLATSPNFAADVQKVFSFDWFSIVPPTPEELHEANKAGKLRGD